jgi:hypothetical protein
MNSYNKMATIVSAMESELQKFHDKHVKVSGKRVRAQCLEVKKLADTLRKEILAATALIEPQLHKAPKKHYLKKEKPVETPVETPSTPVETPVETPEEVPVVKPKRVRKKKVVTD